MSKGTMAVGHIIRVPHEAMWLEGVVRKRNGNRD